MILYLNGAWLDAERARITVEDRGLLHADGVFETALLRGGRYVRLREHLERLRVGADIMGLALPQVTELSDVAYGLLERNPLTDATLRITLTRGTAAGPTLLATLQSIDPDWVRRAQRGWHVITARTRRPPVESMPAQLKALGRTYALLARQEARAADADDALLLDCQGLVCEGPSWNVFWLRDGTLFTPALELGVLAGITRALLLELAPSHGLDTRIGRFERSELDQADEIFATMTSVGIVPFRSLDDRVLPAESPVVTSLRQAYWAAVDRELADRE